MKENLETQKWIDVKILVAISPYSLIKIKKIMKEYADELGWNIKVNKKMTENDEGEKMFGLGIIPKNKKMSPKKLGEEIDHITSIILHIAGDMYPEGIPSKGEDNMDVANYIVYEKKGKLKMQIIFHHILEFIFDFKDMLKLEKQNPKLVKELFTFNFKEEYLRLKEKKGKKGFLRIIREHREEEYNEELVKAFEEAGIKELLNKK